MSEMRLYVAKDTDLMRATFTAIGVARLFDRLPFATGYQPAVRLYDQGSAYLIQVPYSAEQAFGYLHEQELRLPPLLPVILKALTASEKAQKDAGTATEEELRRYYQPVGFAGTVVEYEAEKLRAQTARKAPKGEQRLEGETESAAPDFPLWAHLCSYFGKGSAMRTVYPALVHTWHAHQGATAVALLQLILAGYHDLDPVPLDEVALRWKNELLPQLSYTDFALQTFLTASSLVSPSTVQGASTFTGAKNPNNNPLDKFWLELYFAFAGYMAVGLPYTLSSDVVLYYPLPRNIGLQRLLAQVNHYRQAEQARRLYNYSNQMLRAKLDVLAHVGYYRNLVQHTWEQRPMDAADDGGDWLSGFVGYYYRENGGTQIPFDETVFAMPRWLPTEPTDEKLQQALALLKQHQDLLWALRGKPPKNALTADELVVLNAYRQFITLGEPENWVEFVLHYNLYRFTHVGESYLPELLLSMFEETLMNMQTDKQDFTPILLNTGFRNIAAAIRACTVQAQLFSKGNASYPFKVRYGLGDDLRRSSYDAGKFIEALGGFLHDYARETSNAQAPRAAVTEQDLLEVTALVSQYGARVVASLLVAAGYAWQRKTEEPSA